MIRLSETLSKRGEVRAEKLGISFQEYIKFLILRDVEKPVEILDDGTSKRIQYAYNEYTRGGYSVVNDAESLDRYLSGSPEEEKRE